MQSKQKPQLSVTIITRDEAENIRRCLESVQWADEIIVVDTGSRDCTLSICREFTPLVYEYPWEGFARSKNQALSKATGDWILSLDADEEVSPALKAEILALLEKNADPDMAGFYIPRQNFFWGRWIKHGGFYPDYQLRLFRRGAGVFAERAVHESIEMRGRKGYLQAPLYHYTYQDTTDLLDRCNRYASLAAADLYQRERFTCFRLLGRPLGRFIKGFFLQRGFLDGIPGFILATIYAFYVFQRYVKLWEMERRGGALPATPQESVKKRVDPNSLAYLTTGQQSMVDRNSRSGSQCE